MKVSEKLFGVSTVFLVDDDPAVRESLCLALSLAGLDVRSFASGESFLEAYVDDGGGCLVLDQRMPGMSGLEVQQALNARRATLPIIFMSGHSDSATMLQATKAGAVDFLTKPLRSQELLQRIRSVLGLQAQPG